jgi:hypothetical protein
MADGVEVLVAVGRGDERVEGMFGHGREYNLLPRETTILPCYNLHW